MRIWRIWCAMSKLSSREQGSATPLASGEPSRRSPLSSGASSLVNLETVGRSERLGAGDDLNQLLGDLGLASAIIAQVQGLDHIAGVARGVVHGRHLSSGEASLGFKQRRKDLGAEIARQKRLEDLIFGGLVDVMGALKINRGRIGRGFGRDKLECGWRLGQHVLETRKDQRCNV